MRQWKFIDSAWGTETQLLAPDLSQTRIPIQWIEMAGFGIGIQFCPARRIATRYGPNAQAIFNQGFEGRPAFKAEACELIVLKPKRRAI